MKDKINRQVRDQVFGQFELKIWNRVWGQVCSQVRDQVRDQVDDGFMWNVYNKLYVECSSTFCQTLISISSVEYNKLNGEINNEKYN
jgi:hypothetical protein